MQTRRRIAVAGATGRVGRHVVDVLQTGGHDVVAISRSGGVDVVTGEGLQLVEWGRQGEVSYVPKMRTQLVAARTVTQALADLATDPGSAPAPGSAGAPIPEIAGPREESLVEMATLLAARRGDPARIEGVSDPADPDSDLYETGALLPGPGATLAGPTFQEWLHSTS